MMKMKDGFGREWDLGENELDKYIKDHKLHLEINYTTDPKDKKVYFHAECWWSPGLINGEYIIGDKIIDFKSTSSLRDEDLLLLIKQVVRSHKINQLFNE